MVFIYFNIFFSFIPYTCFIGVLDKEDDRNKAIERADKWISLLKNFKIGDVNLSDDFEPSRIIVKDAERTFSGDIQRKTLSKILTFANEEFQDYHQGMSFVTSFLMLFFDEKTVFSILRLFNNDKYYIPGYWRHEAVPFATDAYVFDALLKIYNPKVQSHLAKNYILPETYLQKWFSALCIHVLEFSALYRFFELFFERGVRFLMQFGLSFFKHLGEKIMSTTNPAQIYAYLRMDRTMVQIEDDISHKILDDVDEFEISEIKTDDQLEAMRIVAYDENLKKRFEAKKRFEEEEEEEEEDEDLDELGMECEVCEMMVPEYYCLDCKKYVCGMCKNQNKETHKKEHKLVDAENAPKEEIKELEEQLKKLEV